MEMKMLYALASILTAICNNAVSVLKSRRGGNLWNSLKYLCHVYTVFRIDSIGTADMCFGHNENMNGCLRINVVESVNVLILINL